MEAIGDDGAGQNKAEALEEMQGASVVLRSERCQIGKNGEKRGS